VNVPEMLKALWFTPGPDGRWGLPMLFEGQPGGGKTARIKMAARQLGLDDPKAGTCMQPVIASLREPSDFLGIPIPQADGSVRYVPGRFATSLASSKRGVLFLDEINTAAPATQAALLRLVNEGWAGDVFLGNGIRVVAAQNAVQDSAGGWDLSAPLANRFGHLPWPEVDAGSWGEWLLGSNDSAEHDSYSAADEEKRVMAAWDPAFAKAKGLVAGFIKARRELLHKMPPAGSEQTSRAWPSPRTWELATRALATCDVHTLSPVDADEIVAAFVGAAAASELIAYRKESDLPDPLDVLDRKVKFAHDQRRLDRTVSIINGCAALLVSPSTESKKERAGVLWEIMGELADLQVHDLCVVPARVLSRAKLGYGTIKVAQSTLAKLSPVLQAAEIDS
jgi:MoxR-like ATPase